VETRRTLSALGLAVAAAGTAHAGGLEIPDRGARAMARGGAFAARADDPTAVEYNPGALSKLRGTHLTLADDLLWSHTRFTRSPSSIASPIDPSAYGVEPTKPVENEDPLFPYGAFLAATSDFGLKDWTFAFSVYGPHAAAQESYPVKGGQRYMLTKLDALLAYVGPSIAWGGENFGVGTTLQYVWMPKLKYSLAVDGQPGGELNPYVSSSDVEATLDLKDDFAYTALIGAWWRPMPALELALSGRVIPVHLDTTGKLVLRDVPDETQFTADDLDVPGDHASLEMVLPPTARLGARYRYLDGDRELFDVEADVAYEAWSVVDSYDVHLRGTIKLLANEPAQDVSIQKRWRDTVSVRVGGTWAVMPDFLRVSAGGLWERGATPHNYADLDFLSLDRYGLSLGGDVTLGDPGALHVDLAVAYSHLFQPDVTVSEKHGKVIQQRPVAQCPDGCGGYSGVPANAGKFESSYDQLAFQANLHF
jgi:long-chain fatty acid transport protein